MPWVAVGRARGDEGSHGAGFGNSLFEDLAVLGFLVIQQGVDVDGLVALADARVNSHGAEEGLHAEGAGFIGNDGHYQLSDFESFSILRSMPTKAMVVETSRPSLPARNSLKSSSWSAARGLERTLRIGT